MKRKLRPYRKHQHGMFRYTLNTRHPALFVEMRLGKCLVTIRRVKLYKPLSAELGLKVLVVAPNAAIGSWEQELTLEGESFTVVTGTKQQRIGAFVKPVRWYLCNKEMFLHLPEFAKVWNWDAVIVDESTFIKNPKAKVTQFFLRNFRDCPHRWVLAGIPNPETDLELWPQLAFLDGRAFGSRNFWDFRARNFKPDISGYEWLPRPGVASTIRRTLGSRAYILRRRDAGVESEKNHIIRELELPPELRKNYDHLEKYFELPTGETTIWSMVKYNWLRRMCGGFLGNVSEPDTKAELVWDGKIQELRRLLVEDLRDEQVVVWFHYNEELHRVQQTLDEVGITNTKLTGNTSRESREERRRLWMKGRYRVILVQQAVAQMGMDLSAADTAIYYSQTPSYLASQQTADRILSLSKNTSLLYLYLVVKNTVDSDLYRALKDKKWTSDMTLSRALKIAMESRSLSLAKSGTH
jgi:SNF2 family DNA or RNA helicase